MDALYARVSLDKTGEALSVARQQEACQHLLNPGFLTFADNSLSATTGKRRDGYQALLAAIKAGQVKRVVVWRQDRLWRNPRERIEGREIFKANDITLVVATGPTIDFSTATGRMLAGILGEVDTAEVEVKGERQVLANQQRARMGKPIIGPRLFGYTTLKDGFTPIADEAKQVKAMFKAFLDGASVHSLADRYGITPLLVRRRLVNPTYAGLRVRDGAEHQGQWKPLVSPEQWRATVALLSARRKPGRPATALLTGIARCSCGATVTAGSGDGRQAYRCRNGHSRQWVREWVEDLVWTYTETLLSDPKVVQGFATKLVSAKTESPDHDGLREEAANLRAGLVTAASDMFRGIDISEQVEQAKRRLAQVEGILNPGTDTDARSLASLASSRSPWRTFQSWPVEVQRACLKRLWTITLTPSPAGRPASVKAYQDQCMTIEPAWF